MPLPSMLTYNELDGSEVARVIDNRVEQFLQTVPYFQKHITLPRVRVGVQVKLEIWADQPNPETIALGDHFDVVVEYDLPTEVFTGESVDTTAPIPGGHPPDQIREMHGLPISEPTRGSRDIGAQIQISDHQTLEGREVEGMPGLRVSRTGSGEIDGMPTSANATVAKIDQGPAGLRQGQMHRNQWNFAGGKNK